MAKRPGRARLRRAVNIPTDGAILAGDLVVPPDACGMIAFAHGSRSRRQSPRNRLVARRLQDAGLATLLLDLLAMEEQDDPNNVFNVDLFAERLLAAMDWLGSQPETEHLCPGLFGASTGAAAALVAASRRTAIVFAVVSRGGRPDLAWGSLREVDAPTLLIVGGEDYVVSELNEQAYTQLHCDKDLAVVPGATHFFDEPGALEQVAELAATWFIRHIAGAAGRSLFSCQQKDSQ